MPRRRSNDEGTIFEYPEGSGIWYAQLPPDEQGKRPKRRAGSQREALTLLREMQRERARGVDLMAKQPTVEQFAATWLEQIVKRTCKATTHANYEAVLQTYVLPRIGALRLHKLTTPRVQQLVNDLHDDDFAPATIRNAYLRLRAMLEIAVQYKLVPYNVAISVRLPKVDRSGQRALTIVEVQALLAAVEAYRLATLYHLFVGLGLRRGEGLGVLWRDLDWDACTIKITQQVLPLKGKTVISTPKTDSSTRTLPLSPYLMDRLREHWRNQQEERRLLGPRWKEHGLIFASEVGTPVTPRNLGRQFSVAVERAGLADVHLHTLRHTCATLLGELGTEERVIGAILGHTPATITAHYAKTTMPMMRIALERLAGEIQRKAA